MLHRLLTLVAAFFILIQPAWSSVGLFVRSDPSSISAPEANKTFCLDTSSQTLKVYDGSTWRPLTLGKINLIATTAPTVNDDSSGAYSGGSIWLNTATDKVYICTSATIGAAVWHELSDRIEASFVLNKFNTSDIFSDFLVNGLIGSDPGSSLAMTTPSGIAYVNGLRIVSSGFANTYTASKDTYDYLQSDGSVNHVEVPNDDPAPSGQDGLLIQKVVTDGSEITAVTGQAPSYPTANVATATEDQHAIPKAQSDAAYAPISIYTSGDQNQVLATPDSSSGVIGKRALVNNDLPTVNITHGGTNNASLGVTNLAPYFGNGSQVVQGPAPGGALYKWRSNSGNTAIESVPDTNGTLTTISMTAPGVLFQSPVSISNPTSTPSISLANRTDVAANRFIGDNGSGSWSERAIASGDLPTVPISKGGTNNASLGVTNLGIYYGDGSKVVQSAPGAASQGFRVNGAGTAIEPYDLASATAPCSLQDGRISLTSGLSVTTTDVTAATNVYFTPHKGNRIALYNGSVWEIKTFSEVTLSLSGLTADLPYDVYIYDSSGVTGELVAWTNGTTRATAIAYQDGVPVKTGATGRRLVGTVLMTGTIGQCEDSVKFRGVSNVDNKVVRTLIAKDSTDSWSYGSTTVRAFNGSSTLGAGVVKLVRSLNVDPARAVVYLSSATSTGSTPNGYCGVGVDSSTVNSAQIFVPAGSTGGGVYDTAHAIYSGHLSVGAHSLYPLEWMHASTTKTNYGDGGGILQSGMVVEILGCNHETNYLIRVDFSRRAAA